ncbi:MAG: cytidine deaminase [Nitrospirota bacterium]|jgi:cytidine deaminase
MSPRDVQSLIAEAEEAMQRALTPYSGFKVGAALLSEDGRTFSGCNIENPSLMLSVCAERVALLKALSEGHSSFKAIAIVSGDGRYCFPCGSCRQLLGEFAPGLDVYLRSLGGTRKYSIRELLPYPFIK